MIETNVEVIENRLRPPKPKPKFDKVKHAFELKNKEIERQKAMASLEASLPKSLRPNREFEQEGDAEELAEAEVS